MEVLLIINVKRSKFLNSQFYSVTLLKNYQVLFLGKKTLKNFIFESIPSTFLTIHQVTPSHLFRHQQRAKKIGGEPHTTHSYQFKPPG